MGAVTPGIAVPVIPAMFGIIVALAILNPPVLLAVAHAEPSDTTAAEVLLLSLSITQIAQNTIATGIVYFWKISLCATGLGQG